MSKRKNSYRDECEKEFNNVKRSLKGQCFAHCSFCKCNINLEAISKAATVFLHTMQLKSTRTLLDKLSQSNL